ncbi:uncharacterized protein EV420DRAFT_87418 [Desarmillaria tabescens]|uniref:Uncharacterized protein n=1 Tax=Armillaria tabescens TaxID=1929756 RepID=A0AA39NQY4_ARMTA|nr:uncharacterized protein EV420DRAFT_87418 [Desarmillaria tabescens]KAK0470060.1 hypothetical protein EV420DRAFT_87418 [Desarmillaria tabescens]
MAPQTLASILPPKAPKLKRRTCYFIIGGVVVGVILVAAVPPILSLIGFGSAGPVAGSLATVLHSAIGNVVAGSPFAIAQSIGMAGIAPGVYVAAGAIGGAVGWFVDLLRTWLRRRNPKVQVEVIDVKA